VATVSSPATNTAYQTAGDPAALRSALGGNVSLRLSGSSADNIRPWSRDHTYAPYRPALILTFAPTGPVVTPTPPPPTPAPSVGGRKVFAHYFPPYPVSIDNKPSEGDYYTRNYLAIDGEGGKHAAYGGLLRDRPVPRAPLTGTDWQVQDLRTEVRQAKAAGIDGFTLDIMGISGNGWNLGLNLMRAARDVGGFKIVPNLDAKGSGATQTPTAVATKLAELYQYSSAQVIDGEYVLSSFKAENKTAAWWKELIASLENTHHVPIKYIAVFNNPSDANMKAFAPISYGFGNWGARSASTAKSMPNLAARAHALGRKWMAPVAFQDARHRHGAYAEASNTETGRATWGRAISDQADFVQIATWNDYSESTTVAPSVSHGNILLDISSYYIDWFKANAKPAITSDHLYLTHRIQPWAAQTTSGIMNMQNTLAPGTAPRDTVEALVFLTAPAEVTLTSGDTTRTFSMAAGTSSVTIPLRPGTASAKLMRGTSSLISLVSPYKVTTTPFVQNFDYHAVGR